jgi:hypothetical protein
MPCAFSTGLVFNRGHPGVARGVEWGQPSYKTGMYRGRGSNSRFGLFWAAITLFLPGVSLCLSGALTGRVMSYSGTYWGCTGSGGHRAQLQMGQGLGL